MKPVDTRSKDSGGVPSASTSLSEQLRSSRLIMWASFFCLFAFGTWAYLAELEEVTRAPGSIISSSRTQLIQSQEGGTLEELLVREGASVNAGQVLVRIERTRAESTYLETRAKLAGYTATKSRLMAEIFGGQPKFPAILKDYPDFKENQVALLRKRRAALEEDLSALENMRRLIKQELEMNLPLVVTGDVSRTEVLRLERQVADFQSQITNKRNKYLQDTQAELSKVEEEMAGLDQTLAQRKNQLEHTDLRAPVKGTVKNVRITTQGGVIRPGEEVMQIVPFDDELLIEARVKPADIAFLKLGLTASIKIDSYDSGIYGSLPGELIFISADTISEDLKQGETAYYRVHVRATSKQFSGRPNAKLEIQPGMTATLEIKTGRKTVLHYLTKPIVKTLSESLGER
jgi:adhesin transport system membrane fusion protein